MIVLIPWKPVVVVWLLLSAMLWCGYVGSSLMEGIQRLLNGFDRLLLRENLLRVNPRRGERILDLLKGNQHCLVEFPNPVSQFNRLTADRRDLPLDIVECTDRLNRL